MSSERPASKRLRLTAEHSTIAGVGGGRQADDGGDEKISTPWPNYFDQLGRDVTSRILSFLGWRDVLRARVRKSLREASRATSICNELVIGRGKLGMHLRKIGAALPGVQTVRIMIGVVRPGHDPVVGRGVSSGTWIDLSDLNYFSRIRNLAIEYSGLNGSYPFLFSLNTVETLSLRGNVNLRFKLDDIAGLPKLREIDFNNCPNLVGDIKSLKHLKGVLERLDLGSCQKVTGNLMNLAEFSSMNYLCLAATNVTGDIRDIGQNHFLSLEQLFLDRTPIYGSPTGLMAIDDAPGMCVAWRRLIAHPRPLSSIEGDVGLLQLKISSPDYYFTGNDTLYARRPPFCVKLVCSGPRYGYRWQNASGVATDITWLDPEPKPSDEGYTEYRSSLNELEDQQRGSIYRGYSRPPTEEEWRQMARE